MSNLAAEMQSFPPDADVATPSPVASDVPRSWFAQVVYRTFGRLGARVGTVWIALVAFGAVFAPVLANSFPILAKIDGRWSSPLFQYLTPVDFILPVVSLAALALAIYRRGSVAVRLAIFAAILVVATAGSLLLVRPKLVRGYEDFRQLENDGKVQWALHAPVRFSPQDHLRDQFDIDRPFPRGPSQQHPLGTDNNGEDILAAMIHACRIAMAIGFISTGIALVIGVFVGSMMGYFSGVVDLVGMRVVEVFSAIPTIYLLLTFCAVFERNIYMVMAIIGLVDWTGDARFVRAEFLKLRNQDFVHAAVAAGLPLRSVLFRHLLPNALAPLLVSASFGVASAVLYESTLSFLGLGLPVDAASWGRLLNEAVGEGGSFHWWLATFPGMAIFLTVFSYNLIGESLRDALDPRLQTS